MEQMSRLTALSFVILLCLGIMVPIFLDMLQPYRALRKEVEQLRVLNRGMFNGAYRLQCEIHNLRKALESAHAEVEQLRRSRSLARSDRRRLQKALKNIQRRDGRSRH